MPHQLIAIDNVRWRSIDFCPNSSYLGHWSDLVVATAAATNRQD